MCSIDHLVSKMLEECGCAAAEISSHLGKDDLLRLLESFYIILSLFHIDYPWFGIYIVESLSLHKQVLIALFKQELVRAQEPRDMFRPYLGCFHL